MANDSAFASEESSEEITGLVRRLHETQLRLLELTGGEVDAVVYPGGQSYLLHDAQEKLRLSEERFQGMYAAAATGIAISTLDGHYLQANVAYCRMLGYTEEELKVKDFTSLTHPDDLDHNLKERDDLLSGRIESFVIEKRYLKKNGETVWARVSVSATHSAQGELATLIVVADDISERKQAEEQLRWKTALLEAQVNSALDGIIIVDTEGKLVLQNQKMTELWNPPSEIFDELDHRKRLRWVAGQVVNPQQFSERVAYLYDHPSEIGRDEIELLNGKIFDRYIAPVIGRDGKHFGRIWAYRDITERKKTEARFRLLVDSNAQGVFFWNTEGKIHEANDAFLNLIGFSRQDMKDGLVDWFGLTPPGFAHLDRMALAELAKDGYCAPFEKEFTRKDGSRVPILLGAATFADNPHEGVCFALDLTDRKRAEREVRFNEQRYRTLVEATTAIVWDTPASGQFTSEQPSWTAFTGQTFEELRGWGWLDAIHPDDQPETKRIWSIALANHTGYFVEHRLRCRDGTYREMAVRAVPILGDHGTIRQWIGIHTDITVRKQSEARIAEQASLLDKTRDAIMVRDLDSRVLFWNKGAERMYGWAAEEALGRKTIDFLHVDAERFKEIHALTLATGEWSGEVRQWTATGSELIVEARWTLIRGDDGQPKSILAVNTDITERKKIEQQFLRAQRMESIGTLAGGIAHDLNNILAPILMSIQILKLTADPEAEKILDTLELSAKRGADVVRQVLSFARGLDGQRIEVQPKHLLEEIESIIKNTFPKNITLQFFNPGDIWTILGDPTQIHQILLNLCVNARDAMPSGGVLTVGVTNCVLDEHYSAMNLHAKAGRYVQISVADSGTGMPKGIIDKIFEPFFTTKGIDKGTGLGLSTVMAIVKSHQGVINVYSEPAKGTTFKVYLPAAELSADAQRKYELEADLPRGNNETILVVDDEASILAITGQTLSAFGYNVLTATDGAEAVAVYALKKQEIAVVLTDMTMPIMDGPATIRALLRLNPRVKIIAASGLTANGGVAKTAEMGVIEFLVKPYTAETMLNALKKVLAEPSKS